MGAAQSAPACALRRCIPGTGPGRLSRRLRAPLRELRRHVDGSRRQNRAGFMHHGVVHNGNTQLFHHLPLVFVLHILGAQFVLQNQAHHGVDGPCSKHSPKADEDNPGCRLAKTTKKLQDAPKIIEHSNKDAHHPQNHKERQLHTKIDRRRQTALGAVFFLRPHQGTPLMAIHKGVESRHHNAHQKRHGDRSTQGHHEIRLPGKRDIHGVPRHRGLVEAQLVHPTHQKNEPFQDQEQLHVFSK